MDIPAHADKCEQCEKLFVGLSGSTKWCPYCGAKHEGEHVPFLEVVGYARSTELAPLLDEHTPDGQHSLIGLDHPTCWIEDEPYEWLEPLYRLKEKQNGMVR
jgi:hypothetical protein